MSKYEDTELCLQDRGYEIHIANKELTDAKNGGNTYQIRRLTQYINNLQDPSYVNGLKEHHLQTVHGRTKPYIAATIPSNQEVDDARLIVVRIPELNEWRVYEDPPADIPNLDDLNKGTYYIWELSKDSCWDDRVRHAIAQTYGTRTPE